MQYMARQFIHQNSQYFEVIFWEGKGMELTAFRTSKHGVAHSYADLC